MKGLKMAAFKDRNVRLISNRGFGVEQPFLLLLVSPEVFKGV